MPIPVVFKAVFDGLDTIPYGYTILKVVPWLVLAYYLRVWFQGATNRSERLMHGKVVMMTGATSGIGAAIARDLATRGAQIIVLTQHALNDPFLVDYIMDLRSDTSNELITAEHVNLASLHSIRTFATKWIDNAPPRRLDMIILCANTFTPPAGKVRPTIDGIDPTFGINYLANFHLLSILSPAIRAQPPDRDVRIIFGNCSSYMGGQLPDFSKKMDNAKVNTSKKAKSTGPVTETGKPVSTSAYATSKYCLTTFAYAFQSHLAGYKRPDTFPMNAKVLLVDPGWTRTPGMRRHLTFGSLWGLLLYLIMWPFWWFVLKSPQQGAQTFLFAAMQATFEHGEGGWFLKECKQAPLMRKECKEEDIQKELWQGSEKMVEALEKEGAIKRAREKKEREAGEAKKKDEKPAQQKPEPETKTGSRRSRKA